MIANPSVQHRVSRLLTACAVACIASVACSPAAAPPDAVVELLMPDTVRSSAVTRGVDYHYLWSPEGPWAVHMLEVDRSRCELSLDVGVPPDARDDERGFGTVSAIVEGYEGEVIAAVNGDFFTAEGRPIGTEASELGARGGASASLVILGGDALEVHRTRAMNSSERVSWDEVAISVPDAGRRVRVVGGLPALLEGGARVGDLEVAARPSFAAARHPRTAIGFDDARTWIVAVDGRREGYSAGMTLPELAELFEALGVTEALNLDGGGSTAMLVQGEVVNRPSDLTGERAVANALLLVDDPIGCRMSAERDAAPPAGGDAEVSAERDEP